MQLTGRLKRLRAARRGSVAVEFALVTTFMLLPLMGAGADFVEILSAQSQLNTTLQSLYYFGYSNPGLAPSSNTAAGNAALTAYNTDLTTVVADINRYATHQAAFTSVSLSWDCVDSGGAITHASTASAPTCPAGTTLQTFASYAVSASVGLTVFIPGTASTAGTAFPLSASGQVEVQ